MSDQGTGPAASQDAEDRHLHGVTRGQQRRAARAAVIGTTMEYYDLGIYATAAATVFATVFFPGTSPGLAAVQAIGTFSVAYVVRPLAAFFLGRLGDRVGRRLVLVACLVIMGVATLGIGLLPSYAAIGWAAPALLILLRIGQGIGASAEFSGATLVAFEFAPRRRRGLYGSAAGFGAAVGGVLASLVMLAATASMSQEAFLSWGWRIPFLASAILVGYGLYLRATLPETPVFRQNEAADRTPTTPVREFFRRWPRAAIAIVLISVANAGLAYFVMVFLVSYANNQMGYERSTVLMALLLSQVLMSVLTPLFGMLADRIGTRKVLGIGLAVAIALSFVLFDLVVPDAPLGLFAVMIIANGISAAAISGTAGAFCATLLPGRIRFTGTATGREIGTALGSGVVPLLAAQLAFVGGESTLPLSGLFLTVAVLGTIGVLLGRPVETVGSDRGSAAPDDAGPPGLDATPSVGRSGGSS